MCAQHVGYKSCTMQENSCMDLKLITIHHVSLSLTTCFVILNNLLNFSKKKSLIQIHNQTTTYIVILLVRGIYRKKRETV